MLELLELITFLDNICQTAEDVAEYETAQKELEQLKVEFRQTLIKDAMDCIDEAWTC
jgi:hypothetical protein